jgi:ribosomal protein L37E
MKAHEFIEKNIGKKVYITGDHDLSMNGELRNFIFCKTEFVIVKLTRGGMAYLQNEQTKRCYAVPPRNVREVIECPKCGNKENYHINYDYSASNEYGEKRKIENILCNECGEFFNLK